MLRFKRYIMERRSLTTNSEASGGGLSNHRGKLAEVAFVNATKQYRNLRKKGHSHDEAINHMVHRSKPLQISDMSKAHKNHPFKSTVMNAAHPSGIGHEETKRTLWDSHHAAISTIDHIHQHHGEIIAPAHHTGGDVTGKSAGKLTGADTNADIIFKVKNKNTGEHEHVHVGLDANHKYLGGSLKYSADAGVKDTKVREHTFGRLAGIVAEHAKRTGLQTANHLRRAIAGHHDVSTPEALHTRLEDHDRQALHRVFNPTNVSGFDSHRKHDMGVKKRPANFSTTNSATTINDAGKRIVRKIAEARSGNANSVKKAKGILSNAGIHPSEHDAMIKHMGEIHDKAFADPKKSSLNNVVHHTVNTVREAASKPGAHRFMRNLLNIPERRSAAGTKSKTLLIKVERGKDNPGSRRPPLPGVKIASPSDAYEAFARRHAASGETGTFHVEHNPGKNAFSIKSSRGELVARGSGSTSGKGSMIMMAHDKLLGFKKVKHPHERFGYQQ